MQDLKVDPRITRTRKLLMEAFLELSVKKDFKDITIKDITDEATVNRATFYSHFQDKYDLMDAAITEETIDDVVEKLNRFDQLNEASIINIFIALTDFHTDLSKQLNTQCRRSYLSFISMTEQKLKSELEKIIHSLLLKQHSDLDPEALKIGAAVLSSSIYGASADWKNNSTLPAEEYIEMALPFIVTEINTVKDED